MIAILTLTAALLGQDPARSPATAPETVVAVKSALDDGLVDYPSARFRDVRLVTRPSNTFVTLAVCGEYNSRTRDGGYSGWTRFVLLNDRLSRGEGNALERRGWQVWCEGADVVILDPDITTAVSPSAQE